MDTSSLVVRTQRGNTSSPISMKGVEFIFIKELEFIKEIEFIVKNLTKKTPGPDASAGNSARDRSNENATE